MVTTHLVLVKEAVTNICKHLQKAIKRAQVPAVKEPVSLTLEDNKRPDGTTLLPGAKGKPLAWDVTVPDTYVTCLPM